MRFTLNNETVEALNSAPNTTLLNFLREQQSLTGTKEGCGSGDCGACTVIVSKEVAGEVRYQAVNSCIYPVESLENQHVITIDKLQDLTQDKGLSSIQTQMVECHGSQCGFCTPGFIMSLTALQTEQNTGVSAYDTKQKVIDAISGNLCRCTGYRPIVEAACEALKKPNQALNIVQTPQKSADSLDYPPATPFTEFFARPTSEDTLQAWMQQYPKAQFIAGGTDLMLTVTQQYKPLSQLIDLTHIPSLQQITESETHVDFGAATTYLQLESFAKQHSPVLYQQLLHRLGSRQIRNRGTLGGNICNASPIGDMPPYLLALDAQVELTSSTGSKRLLPITEFFVDYKKTKRNADEYLSKIRIAQSALAQPTQIFKISKRYEDDISAILGVFTLSQSNTMQIAFGGMAAVPIRARQTEAYLAKHKWDPATGFEAHVLQQACDILKEEFSPISDVRASSAYRQGVSANLLKKACWSMLANQTEELSLGVFGHA
jgi:xanthine dehydrogenase small subunit